MGSGRMACQLSSSRIFALAFVYLFICVVNTKTKEKNVEKKDDDRKNSWKKKDIRDYSEADLERLYQQWEEDDEPLEEDEKPEWEREPPKIDMSQLDPSNPEAMLQMSKKGRTLMMFASVSGNPTEKETETITGLWQTSLHNANVETQRYVVGTDRVIFMLKDGSKAWFVKDFLVTQERCSEVTIEGKNYTGKGAEGAQESQDDNRPSKKSEKDDDKNNKKQKKSENEIVKEKKIKKDKEDKKTDKKKTEL